MVEGEPKVAADLADDDEVQVDFMKMKKKKKGKKGKKAMKEAVQAKAAANTGFDWNVDGHRSYEFSELLDRIEQIMNEKMS